MKKSDKEKIQKVLDYVHSKNAYGPDPQTIITVENMIVNEIEQRLLNGQYSCLECELDAIMYHDTIKKVFMAIKERKEEVWKDTVDA